jgi:hypothetical protein
VNLGYKPGSTSYPKILQLLDVWTQKIGSSLGHQSDRKMLRAYFPECVTAGTKLAGHEMNGVILALLILCKMKKFSTWLDELIRKDVGMEVVAEITICSTQRDPGI